jgi:hypothetical protein
MSLDFSLIMYLDTGGKEPYEVELFSQNITHNLNEMAERACIYMALWRPDELFPDPTAGNLIPLLEAGLAELRSLPKYYKQFNAANGWGTYDDFVPFVENVLNACKSHPKATVSVSR